MIFLRLVYVLRVRVRGSKFGTYQSLACIPFHDRRVCSVERHVIETLVSVLNGELKLFLPLYFIVMRPYHLESVTYLLINPPGKMRTLFAVENFAFVFHWVQRQVALSRRLLSCQLQYQNIIKMQHKTGFRTRLFSNQIANRLNSVRMLYSTSGLRRRTAPSKHHD